MNLGIKDRVAVVGGASSGLGRATAEALAQAGCHLLLWGRDVDRLAPVAEELSALTDGRIEVTAADAGRPECAETVAAAALERFGRVDIVVLNAGGPPPCDPLATDADGWRDALQLLTVTPIDLATRLLGQMQERKWGRVVAILSSGVREPIDHLAYSNGGRVALASWLKTISRPLAADGITVNSVMPGRIATPRIAFLDEAAAKRRGLEVTEVQAESLAAIPAGRYGGPEQFGATVAFLCSEPAAYQTGTIVPVDGGLLRGL
jgi:3-oxoacyl-[acyl-carrier protein] reductase